MPSSTRRPITLLLSLIGATLASLPVLALAQPSAQFTPDGACSQYEGLLFNYPLVLNNQFEIEQINDGDTSEWNGFVPATAANGRVFADTITFDLGDVYTIEEFVLWNDIVFGTQGVRDFNLDFYDATGAFVSSSAAFTTQYGAPYTPQNFAFPAVSGVASVDMVITSVWDANGIEIREVAFSGFATGGTPPVSRCSPAVDTDADGVTDDTDNCPTDANTDQADLDGDGSGDACDADADGDGDPAGSDCDDLDPARYAGAAELCADGIDNNCNGLVDQDDVGGDCDADGVGNGSDNCPLDYNPGQEDLDGDGAGNACDDDDDGDGVNDLTDNCPVVANDQADFDGDGAGDACDADGDGDGVDDAIDLCHFSAPSDQDDGVPSRGLGKNRWADIDGNGTFDTTGNNPTGRSFTMDETLGCGCAQIIEICGYGAGHTKFGCSNSVMDTWTGTFDEAGGPVGSCK